ncbi:hypothetical protein Dimus_035488 [Dionaea muscipula]
MRLVFDEAKDPGFHLGSASSPLFFVVAGGLVRDGDESNRIEMESRSCRSNSNRIEMEIGVAVRPVLMEMEMSLVVASLEMEFLVDRDESTEDRVWLHSSLDA